MNKGYTNKHFNLCFVCRRKFSVNSGTSQHLESYKKQRKLPPLNQVLFGQLSFFNMIKGKARLH